MSSRSLILLVCSLAPFSSALHAHGRQHQHAPRQEDGMMSILPIFTIPEIAPTPILATPSLPPTVAPPPLSSDLGTAISGPPSLILPPIPEPSPTDIAGIAQDLDNCLREIPQDIINLMSAIDQRLQDVQNQVSSILNPQPALPTFTPPSYSVAHPAISSPGVTFPLPPSFSLPAESVPTEVPSISAPPPPVSAPTVPSLSVPSVVSLCPPIGGAGPLVPCSLPLSTLTTHLTITQTIDTTVTTHISVPNITTPGLPTGVSPPSLSVSAPSVAVPSLSAPSLAAPSLSAPSLAAPSLAAPSFVAPSLAPPSLAAPSISAPSLAVPSVSAPSLAAPSVSAPSLAVPPLSLASPDLPSASLPSAALPSTSLSLVAPGLPTSSIVNPALPPLSLASPSIATGVTGLSLAPPSIPTTMNLTTVTDFATSKLVSIPTPSTPPFVANARDNLAVYYGNSPATHAGGLSQVCNNTNTDIIILSFVYDFFSRGGYPSIWFGQGSCDSQTPAQIQKAPGLSSCAPLAQQIVQCQQQNKKVLVSLGGYIANSSFSSDLEARRLAVNLWNLFGAGAGDDPTLRPFGSVIVDGFDIDNEDGSTAHWDTFVSATRALFASDGSKQYFLSAAPQCPYPDASNSISTLRELDFVWVQFYNNPSCNLDSTGFQVSFRQWSNALQGGSSMSTSNKAVGPQYYIGIPAFSAAGSGYVDPSSLSTYISLAKELWVPNQGGIMLWDGSEALQNIDAFGNSYLDYAKWALQH